MPKKDEDGIVLTNEEKDMVIRALATLQAEVVNLAKKADSLGASKARQGASDQANKLEDLKQKFL